MSELTQTLASQAEQLREIAGVLDNIEVPEFEFDVYNLDWSQRAEVLQSLIVFDQDEVAEALRDAGYNPVDLSDVAYTAGQIADGIDSLRYTNIEDAVNEISDLASAAYNLQSELESVTKVTINPDIPLGPGVSLPTAPPPAAGSAPAAAASQ